MKAVVFRGVGDVAVEDVQDAHLESAHDAVVRVTASGIGGTDLHLVRGTLGEMAPGTILGREAVGVVEAVGEEVRNLREGDRVAVCSSIGCGYCSYCRSGYYSQCDNANPNGPRAGTCFFGGPKWSGSIHGTQAEYVRVPFANVGLVRIPDEITDDEAIFLSDILPTGYFGAKLAEIKNGDTVAIFGCGAVGLMAIQSAMLLGAGRVIGIDRTPSRLELAASFGAEAINFDVEDPVETILNLTGGIGVDRAIDAVGVDAVHPESGPGAERARAMADEFRREVDLVASRERPDDGSWMPGDAPMQASLWAVEALAKAGTLAVVGEYPDSASFFPFGRAMGKNLTVNMGNCNHRKYVPQIIEHMEAGALRPAAIHARAEPLERAVSAYKTLDVRPNGWVKIELVPEGAFVEA